jgi:tetratricopeptide (TPR) repeat protein
MTTAPEHDRLVARLLREIDRAGTATSPSGGHPDEETLALFAHGELRDPERAALIRHLAECPECRKTAGAVLSWPEMSESVARPGPERNFWRRKPALAWVSLAAAASVLLAVGMLVRVSDQGGIGVAASEREAYAQAVALTEQGRFDEARAVVAEAGRRGVKSDRLRSVESQALRQMPTTLALAYAGRLSDFGYEIGGATARSAAGGNSAARAQEALALLAPSDSEDDSIALNRGHALLCLQRPREALAEFQRVTGHAPVAPLASLGEGLAFFALANYPPAENAFRACLRLDPNLNAARINLAMTLGEEGKIEEALAMWNEVLARPQGLSNQDRRAIEQEVEELRQAQRRPSSPPSSGSPSKEKR